MSNGSSKKKVLTDFDVKRKAIKLVIAHLKKKVSQEFLGSEYVNEWIDDMDVLLQKKEFEMIEYIEMRKKLNAIIERIPDEEMRFKVRDSWYSMGKAMDKKVKRH